MVVHAHPTDARAGLPPRVGFVVSKAVGGAVVRNRTRRRLRALVASRLDRFPDGVDVVVRAHPPAAAASSAELARALDPLVDRVLTGLGGVA
jgi:ribonuclease P protein component